MSKTIKPIVRKNTPAPPLAQQQAIAEQTAAFLAKGGKVEQIPSGVSGQQRLGGPQYGRPVSAAAVKGASSKSNDIQ